MNKNIIFIGLGFILITAGVFGFWYYRDSVFSKEILKLEILGPDTAKAGEEITYTIQYKNNGNFVLENPKLIFNLPDNSLTEDGKNRLTQDVKDIYPGDQELVQFKTRLLGKENDLKIAHAWLSYTPKNLSARYESDTTFTTKLDAVPITLSFDVPSKVEKGKEISYSVNYFSNIDYPLENLSIKIDPVVGFNLSSAIPASLDNVEWKLATLQKSQGGRITFKGLITADSGTSLNFSAKLGMWQDGVFLPIKEATENIDVISPLLFISQQINGSSNYIASPGQALHYEIFLRNIGSSPFDNVFLMSRIEGSAFDLSTLRSSQGQAKPNDNLIVFDSKQIPEIQHLLPNQEAKVSFDVMLKSDWVPTEAEKNNALLKNKINVADISQEFDTQINSNIQLAQKGYYASPEAMPLQPGFDNLGPIPPQVGKATTYTIVWQIKNYLNNVKNVKVKAILPKNVTLTAVLPDNQIPNFSLDNVSRQIVWLAGDLGAGSGVTASAPSVSFQISLTPTLSQKGQLADLIGQATVSAEDQATGAVVSNVAGGIKTDLPDDKINSGGGIVK